MRTKSSSFILHASSLRRAFTLVELLVVIGIIAVLISILFPVVGKIREAARETDTRALVTSIEAACQSYYADFNAMPGPLSTSYITALNQTEFNNAPAGWRNTDTGLGERVNGVDRSGGFNDCAVDAEGIVQASGERVTEAENVVLGLLGGVTVNKVAVNQYYLEYDATTVGNGPASLNPVRPGTHGAYMQKASLSAGKFKSGDSGDLSPSKDSRIPEFVDRWPDPMPILVLRARIGGKVFPQTVASAFDEKNNNVVVNIPYDPNATGPQAATNGQYNLVEITPYTQSSIGIGHKLGQGDYVPTTAYNQKLPHGLISVDVTKGIYKSNGADYAYPYDAFSYLADPTSYSASDTAAVSKGKMKARKQDGIILISAGKDRVYGTSDDIVNFGSVLP